MSDEELEERLDVIEKGIHERFDSIHRRHKRIENVLRLLVGLMILLLALVSYSWYAVPQP